MAFPAHWSPAQQHRWRALDDLESKITELWGYLNAATARFLALVAEFGREKAYERHGLANTAQWLNWQCGIGAVAAREKVRVARALEHLPEISDALAKGEISYSKVRAMTHRDARERIRPREHRTARDGRARREALQKVRVVRESNKEVTAETALQIRANAWHADALRLMAESFLEHRGEATGAGSSADRLQVVVHIDHAILSEQQAAAEAGEPHRCDLEDGPALALDTARRLACDATIVGIVEGEDGEPLDIGRKSRSIPTAIARALRSRDGGCRYPGCDRTRWCDGHHLHHWADGGKTKLENLITRCDFQARASKRMARNVSAETICRRPPRPIAASRTACATTCRSTSRPYRSRPKRAAANGEARAWTTARLSKRCRLSSA